ncbi:RHS repeat domain-containing protein [Pseudomonas sp. EA_65y_Pfl2_P78]|uniref:RHS repeat domain-containing protein n=2 Tax=unclassified Pseudomonas TaxID=196821 RepID=UPI0030DCE34F
MIVHHDTATPTLSVMDSRSQVIRRVGYCRHPDQPDIDPRITRQMFDAAGRQVASWDPRLWGTAPKPNLATAYGLSGQALLTDSVDAGWQLSLLNQAGLTCSFWDARGSQRHTEFDEQQRPVALKEQARGEPSRVVERLTYAAASDAFAQHNQCGRLIRHDDPAGNRIINDYGLTGAELAESRRFLTALDLPDWPTDPDVRDEYLEEKSYITRHAFYPTGELQRQIDAMGNTQTVHYNVSGKPSATWLLLAGEGKPSQCLFSDIQYNAQEQIERETAGNGVVSRAEYSPDDGRLLSLIAGLGEQPPLQNLHYGYDPVGNIVSLEDKTQAVTYFNHQRIEPISRYRYDSLYQLVEAKGWEVSQPSHGPALPDLLPTPLDPNQRRNYTQTFDYDTAGNLITRHHSGAPGFSMFTSAHSNRGLGQRDDGTLPGEPQITLGFDACGNQLELQRGQAMLWDIRNQLSQVTLVKREGEADDYESYAYDRPGHRLRKAIFSQSNRRTLHSEIRYLPGLEIHRQASGEVRHVVRVEAGPCSVRVLHWPEGNYVDQQRYSLSDHLGSSTLELNEQATVLTQEHYYPFGGTACWAGKSAGVANDKTIRYSGKERDATGLYYYGHRYYAPWLQRWISPDPAGEINGLNIFCFVANNPVARKDVDGRFFYEGKDDFVETALIGSEKLIAARGLDAFPMDQASVISSQLSEVEKVFAEATYVLTQGYAETSGILQSYFGPQYSAVENRLPGIWTRGRELANAYGRPAARGKFLGFIAVPGTARHSTAEVRPGDFYGRIAINLDRVNGNSGLVLGHELMHLNRVSRVSAVGPGALDNFYLNSNSPELLNYPVMQYDLPARGLSEAIMHGGLNLVFSQQYTASHRDFITSVGNYMGMPDILDLETSIEMFNQAPHLRAEMAANNADSLVYAAKSMSDLYRSRQEDNNLFNNLLYG